MTTEERTDSDSPVDDVMEDIVVSEETLTAT